MRLLPMGRDCKTKKALTEASAKYQSPSKNVEELNFECVTMGREDKENLRSGAVLNQPAVRLSAIELFFWIGTPTLPTCE